MNYALMRDWHVMVKGPSGAEWRSLRGPFTAPLMLWPTRESAERAVEALGRCTVVAENQIPGRVSESA